MKESIIKTRKIRPLRLILAVILIFIIGVGAYMAIFVYDNFYLPHIDMLRDIKASDGKIAHVYIEKQIGGRVADLILIRIKFAKMLSSTEAFEIAEKVSKIIDAYSPEHIMENGHQADIYVTLAPISESSNDNAVVLQAKYDNWISNQKAWITDIRFEYAPSIIPNTLNFILLVLGEIDSKWHNYYIDEWE